MSLSGAVGVTEQVEMMAGQQEHTLLPAMKLLRALPLCSDGRPAALLDDVAHLVERQSDGLLTTRQAAPRARAVSR